MAITSKNSLMLIIRKWKCKFFSIPKITRFQCDDVKNLNWKLTLSAESLQPQRMSYPTLLWKCLMSFSQKTAWFHPFHHQLVGLARKSFATALSSKWIWLQQFWAVLAWEGILFSRISLTKACGSPWKVVMQLAPHVTFSPSPWTCRPRLVSYGCGNVPLPHKPHFEVLCLL